MTSRQREQSGHLPPLISAPGLFGKIPSLGDFVSRRLPRDFVETWDSWLQSALESSRAELEAKWLDLYLTSPIWRFALPASLCGSSGWVGVLMPSVDQVGRYFPLTVALGTAPDLTPFDMLSNAPQWLPQAEALMLRAIEDEDFGIELLDEGLLALDASHAAPAERPARIEPPPASLPWRIALSTPDFPAPRLAGMLDALLTGHYGPYSLWWTAGSERVDPSLLVCISLPAGEQFVAMLGGNWSAHSCHDSPLSLGAEARDSEGLPT